MPFDFETSTLVRVPFYRILSVGSPFTKPPGVTYRNKPEINTPFYCLVTSPFIPRYSNVAFDILNEDITFETFKGATGVQREESTFSFRPPSRPSVRRSHRPLIAPFVCRTHRRSSIESTLSDRNRSVFLKRDLPS